MAPTTATYSVLLSQHGVSVISSGLLDWVEPDLTITLRPHARGTRSRKAADVELHFKAGQLAGVQLLGSVWESQPGTDRTVIFPVAPQDVCSTARAVRHACIALRPGLDVATVEQLRGLILDAYDEYRYEPSDADLDVAEAV